MRDIKFRAWDKKTKKMRTVESIGFGELSYYNEGYPVVNMIGRDCINDKDIIIHRDSYQYELMQYTGLKDKNGKEIYEGDILKFFNDVDYIIKPGYAKVVFEDGEFCCKHYKYGTEYLANMDVVDMDITVAGNIYKDKHLLEEEI